MENRLCNAVQRNRCTFPQIPNGASRKMNARLLRGSGQGYPSGQIQVDFQSLKTCLPGVYRLASLLKIQSNARRLAEPPALGRRPRAG